MSSKANKPDPIEAIDDQPEPVESAGGLAPGLAGGLDIIRERVKTLPNQPGVYRMLNAKGDALYVGKARNLKKRVDHLHAAVPHRRTGCSAWWPRPRRMEIVTTHTEVEALLLEINLIKR